VPRHGAAAAYGGIITVAAAAVILRIINNIPGYPRRE
jgi:hypothetical protein